MGKAKYIFCRGMNTMTFEQLEYFVEVYQQKSITNAANNLFVTRQALSGAIRRFENELDITLFERAANKLIPTEIANQIYLSALAILEENSVMNQKINMHKLNNICRETKISLPEALIPFYGDEIINRLTKLFPNNYFNIISSNSDDLHEILQSIDICMIIINKNDYKNIQSLKLNYNLTVKLVKKYPLYIWMSNISPLNRIESLSFQNLKDVPVCILKNTYNGIGPLKYLGYDIVEQIPRIDFKHNFVNYLETKNYFTIDMPLYKDELLYQSILGNNSKLVCRKTIEEFCLVIIYKDKVWETFCSIIEDLL